MSFLTELRHIFFPNTYPNPKPGEKYRLIGFSRDPFEEKDTTLALVLEVKEGWVKYRLGDVTTTNQLKRFKSIYIKEA